MKVCNNTKFQLNISEIYTKNKGQKLTEKKAKKPQGHDTKKPYDCNLCNKVFRWPCEYTQHAQRTKQKTCILIVKYRGFKR